MSPYVKYLPTFLGFFLKTSHTTLSENFSIYFVLRNICFQRDRKKTYKQHFCKSQKCGILSLFRITKKLSTGFVYKNVYCFTFIFPNNPQNLKPGHMLVFKEKDLTGLVSTPLFGFSVSIFPIKLSNKMFLKGKMIIYINCSD